METERVLFDVGSQVACVIQIIVRREVSKEIQH